MNQIAREYKQAIIIGASPMGNEAAQLLALLRWAGYGAQEESCTRNCTTCRSGCHKPEMKKDIYVIAADGGLGFLLKNKLRPEGFWARLQNFIMNSLWSIVWLGRWTIRLLKKLLRH